MSVATAYTLAAMEVPVASCSFFPRSSLSCSTWCATTTTAAVAAAWLPWGAVRGGLRGRWSALRVLSAGAPLDGVGHDYPGATRTGFCLVGSEFAALAKATVLTRHVHARALPGSGSEPAIAMRPGVGQTRAAKGCPAAQAVPCPRAGPCRAPCDATPTSPGTDVQRRASSTQLRLMSSMVTATVNRASHNMARPNSFLCMNAVNQRDSKILKVHAYPLATARSVSLSSLDVSGFRVRSRDPHPLEIWDAARTCACVPPGSRPRWLKFIVRSTPDASTAQRLMTARGHHAPAQASARSDNVSGVSLH